jgi:integrase
MAGTARDTLMISLAYHHGPRVSELIGLQWDVFDLKAETIAIKRKKGGVDGVPRRMRVISGGACPLPRGQ